MKRFTETDKWKDPWFRRLDGRMKLLWFWLCDQCDGAGVIDPDMDLATFQIGIAVSEMDLNTFGDRLKQIQNGKWMLTKFIPFQYGELSEACPAHKPVFRSLENNRVLNGYSKGINTLQDKDKDKDKEKDKETDTRPRAQKSTNDEDWLNELETSGAYDGIDIRTELTRAHAWAHTNRRQCTRRFFTNWLAKADRMAPTTAPLPPSKKY